MRSHCWGVVLLAAAFALALFGHAVAFVLYFFAPHPAYAELEYRLQKLFPTYYDCLNIGGSLVVFLWMLGCVVLLRRVWPVRRMTLREGAWAAATPAAFLVLGAAWWITARQVAPLSIRF